MEGEEVLLRKKRCVSMAAVAVGLFKHWHAVMYHKAQPLQRLCSQVLHAEACQLAVFLLSWLHYGL